MKLDLFSCPIWIQEINISKIKLTSRFYKDHFLSKTKSSFSQNAEDNYLSQESADYLLNTIANFLQNFQINKIYLSNIWRNVYDKNGFQDIHFHSECDFCFIIYEKLNNPQTVFLNPAYDLIKEKNLGKFINEQFIPNVKEGDIVFFPAYLKHYVKDANDSITISGNINLE